MDKKWTPRTEATPAFKMGYAQALHDTAAPDLYDALENCFNALMSHIHNEYDGVYTEQDFAKIEYPYRAALAKAEGRTE